ncbi:TetR/AcrR family transcriptional regulator [Marmoricola sp. RAF53]|uniref:TetR/AcrR family transcriptional regulator n=1 Tax=Marmoricola sp. RAF53 TaxID=3233059 RepID=UPI003F97BC26
MTTSGTTSGTTPRDRARARTMQEITRIGRQHLATDGAAALSLRAVARDLGVVSSAVYRYVKSRDELLTLLLVDGYDELGDEVDAAVAAVPADDHRAQLFAIARTVRAWALREPATYALLFGSPVPGYQAPGERTTGPGTRVIRALIAVWENAWRAGRVELPANAPVTPAVAADVERIRAEFGLSAPPELVARGVLAWTALFGSVSFEVFGQYGPDTFTDTEAVFEHQVALLADLAGLVDPPG